MLTTPNEELADDLLEAIEDLIKLKRSGGGPKQERPIYVEIKRLRQQLKLTQSEFSTLFGIPVATLKNWEQGRRSPSNAEISFLNAIKADPAGVAKMLVKA